jgi:hypothetical protein
VQIDLNQPQIVAALIGGSVAAIVSLAVAVINQFSLRGMHGRSWASIVNWRNANSLSTRT